MIKSEFGTVIDEKGLVGGVKSRHEFIPPSLWPEPEFPIQDEEFPVSAKERAKREQRRLDSRRFVSRMATHPFRIKIPSTGIKIETYASVDEDLEGGCTSLPNALVEPLSRLYFPHELYSRVSPKGWDNSRSGGDSQDHKHAPADQFFRNANTTKSLNRLAVLESRLGDQYGTDKRERMASIDSQESQDEGNDEEDIGDGDYEVDHFADNDDDGLDDIDVDDEPTM